MMLTLPRVLGTLSFAIAFGVLLMGGTPLTGNPLATAEISEVARRIDACRDGCAGVVYLWSERMPLSRAGVESVESAAAEVGMELTFLESEILTAYAEAEPGPGRTEDSGRDPLADPGPSRDVARVADQLLATGALAHAPALVVHAEGRVLGPAILGYKTSGAYAAALRRRLSGAGQWDSTRGSEAGPGGNGRVSLGSRASRPPRRAQAVTELEAVGRPGAYFRWVPGRQAVAYESRGAIYLLDLSGERSREAPGYVDFIPSPDGRFFVTPAPRRSGMEFYDAGEVFEAVQDGEPDRVDPSYTDPAMRDQYPSVGILEQEGAADDDSPAGDTDTQGGRSTVYRILTSWFEGIRYRDYRVTGTPGEEMEIRPLGSRVEPCREMQLSIPIMSQDGLEVAARDESTGTTKIFRLLEGGRCEEVADLGVQTGKVAWHWSGRLLAFARPPLRARIGPGFMPGRPPGGSRDRARGGTPAADLQAADGIFLYDRDAERMTRVEGSEDASSLAFPEFIGDDRLVYLVPGESGEPTVFRVVEGDW
ncbi:MAG: hypothetical protein R3223_00420 [Longimicrobiales bacterium]|nr:hypothetical protein [Longimicrobiales bacterium]